MTCFLHRMAWSRSPLCHAFTWRRNDRGLQSCVTHRLQRTVVRRCPRKNSSRIELTRQSILDWQSWSIKLPVSLRPPGRWSLFSFRDGVTGWADSLFQGRSRGLRVPLPAAAYEFDWFVAAVLSEYTRLCAWLPPLLGHGHLEHPKRTCPLGGRGEMAMGVPRCHPRCGTALAGCRSDSP